ncbi:metal-sulfur cluster assembly factor [Microbacterium sp. EST19A]|uniref:metal-sulfur cluster assembly factor n=1 Tax=Microbacterium sp. EST19A TaxID=2862681 RepID=UPI001CBB3D04|nr:metal-sulfur cluster assembly factor [Microbacterium sp. EST19A]
MNTAIGEITREDRVLDALYYVMDPELGIDVVNLGLVYGVEFDGDIPTLRMTLTSAGCPLTDVIEDSVAEALDGVVDAFRIDWVWMPPWSPERISEEGRDMLEALGFRVRRA